MIKNIIFDFGGVLLNLDYHKTYEALGPLMGLEFSFDDLPQKLIDLNLVLERGEMKPETFMWNIQKLAKKQITQPHKIISAWNAMLLGWNPDRLPWLLELKEKYHTFLLSNTNAIHIDWVRRDLKKNYGVEDFESRYFDCVHYSHDMGMQKPDPNIYKAVLDANNLVAGESLFIDDNADNIAAANALGIHTAHHDPKTEIMDMLEGYITDCQ